jgi:uncharacterized protein YdbL (DUF1318 family)
VTLRVFLVLIGAMLTAAPAAGQSPGLASAIGAGQVGERFDGYMGFVNVPSGEVRRQVAAINLRRRNLYIELAARRNVTPEAVGIATACELLGRVGIGEAYMLKDGAWRRRAAGQPAPVPDYCR